MLSVLCGMILMIGSVHQILALKRLLKCYYAFFLLETSRVNANKPLIRESARTDRQAFAPSRKIMEQNGRTIGFARTSIGVSLSTVSSQ